VSLGRRLGRLARGFVSNINEERLKETIRVGRERGETLKGAFEAAWRGAAEEWRAAEERSSRERAFGEPLLLDALRAEKVPLGRARRLPQARFERRRWAGRGSQKASRIGQALPPGPVRGPRAEKTR
jgi:hypothetical protein